MPASFKPGRSYRVIVKAGLKDEYGQALARDLAFPVEVDDLWPHVEMGLEGSIFEASFRSKRGRPRELPITSVNTESFDVVTSALDEAAAARLTSLEGLYLARPLVPRDIIVDRDVARFMSGAVRDLGTADELPA